MPTRARGQLTHGLSSKLQACTTNFEVGDSQCEYSKNIGFKTSARWNSILPQSHRLLIQKFTRVWSLGSPNKSGKVMSEMRTLIP